MSQESHIIQASTARLPWYARPWALRSLQHRDWRVLWMAGHLWNLAFWMDLIVLGWVVLELTDSAFKVALVGTFRFLPICFLGVFAGSQADRRSKKSMLIFAQAVNLTVTAGFTVVLGLDLLQVWHVYVVATLTGCAWAIDFPVRRAFFRDILPERAILNAVALSEVSETGTEAVGRWLAGGFLVLAAGAAFAYGFLAMSYLIGLVILLSIPGRPVYRGDGEKRSGVLEELKEGLRYVWRNQALRGVVIITVFVNFLIFPYMQLTPVFARDVFGVGPALMGLMSGMDGVGAFIGAAVFASMMVVRRPGIIFIAGALLMGLGVFLFAVSPSYGVAMPMLFLAGLGISGFVTFQTTITITAAEPEMRGRAMGAVSLGVGFLPIGMLYTGALAEWLGAPTAVAINTLACIVILLIVSALLPGLRRASLP